MNEADIGYVVEFAMTIIIERRLSFMRIYVCDDTFEAKMTAIYEAWAWAAAKNSETKKNGGTHNAHDDIDFAINPVYQTDFLDEYIYVEASSEKAEKVVNSIQRDISKEAYVAVYYAAISSDIQALYDIYSFLRFGFRFGYRATSMLSEPSVQRIMTYRRRIGNEVHHFREFVRFSKIIIERDEPKTEMYISHIEPKSDIVYLVGGHFADRMPSEHWIIIDDIRKKAAVHPASLPTQEDKIEYAGFYSNMYQKYLTDEEYRALTDIEELQDEYIDLWKTFFDAIGIKERENYKCQRNLFPLWMRKHVTEFK